jgi:hypothetical protein
MSAKNKKSARPAAPAAAAATAPAAAAAPKAPDASEATMVPALESSDPKRRMIGQITLVVFCLYVAAVWLLALDQQFHWGIFKP